MSVHKRERVCVCLCGRRKARETACEREEGTRGVLKEIRCFGSLSGSELDNHGGKDGGIVNK